MAICASVCAIERRVRRGPEIVFVFGNFFGDLNRVAANRPERRRELFAAVGHLGLLAHRATGNYMQVLEPL